jgi:hypothetical protein
MIRAIIFTAFFLPAMATKAQVTSFSSAQNSTQAAARAPQQERDTNYLPKKWFITKYAGISAGFVAFKGGSGNFLSAPLELLLNRQLTNNLYAFGGVSATPYLLQYNGAFYQPGVDKNYRSMRINNAGIYPAAKIGLMYISNDRTFSVSGSISVSRSSYNNFLPMYAPVHSHVQ